MVQGFFDSLFNETSIGGAMKTNHTQATHSIEIAARQTVMPFFLNTAIIIVVSLFALHSAEAAAGDLDFRFGNGGVAITDFSQTDDYAYSVAVQADGKIVLSGQSGVYPDLHSALVRYNRSGRLDSTFGTGGKGVRGVKSIDQAYGVALDSNGKIVLAGVAFANGANFDFAVARYLGR